jgi:conjugative coupling factor TraD (TOL family)
MKIDRIESLLRPVIEWRSAVVLLIGSGVILIFPSLFLLNHTNSLPIGGILLVLACWRFHQGYEVKRYQNHLRALPDYTISSKEIVLDPTRLFLGKGFRWGVQHTQRLFECKTPTGQNYLLPKQNWFSNTKNTTSSEVGGTSALHGVELEEDGVWMPLKDRVGHTLVLGTTRVGKTRLLEVLMTQDIRRGDVVIVFDPKGDTQLLRRLVYEAALAGRAEDVVIFHVGFPQVSARYNPIGQFARISEVANRIANQLPSSGESAAFREFAWRFVNIIVKALVALGRIPDYRQISKYLLTIDELLADYCQQYLPAYAPNWKEDVKTLSKEMGNKKLPIHMQMRSPFLIALVQYIREEKIADPILEGLCGIFNYDKTYFDKITASLLPLIDKLTTGQVASLITPTNDPNDPRDIFDWQQVIRGKKIVYVGLDALSDSTIAGAIGNSMFADLCSVAGQIYKYGVEYSFNPTQKTLHPVCVHSDEFNELIGDEFIPLLNKSGGAGFQVTAYTQTWSDIEARLESRAKAGQVAGNLNTLICLRVLDEATADLLTSKLSQKVPVSYLQHVSSVNDGADLAGDHHFTSQQEDKIVTTEVPLLTPNDLIQLPKGQCFALLEGGQLWKIRLPLPRDSMNDVPFDVEGMVRYLQQQAVL